MSPVVFVTEHPQEEGERLDGRLGTKGDREGRRPPSPGGCDGEADGHADQHDPERRPGEDLREAREAAWARSAIGKLPQLRD